MVVIIMSNSSLQVSTQSNNTNLMTAEELFKISDDGYRYELNKGRLRKMAPAGIKHGVIASRLDARLQLFVEQHNLGIVCAAETGFYLEKEPDTVKAADVSFYAWESIPDDIPEGYGDLPPDLAVEVMSPNDTFIKTEEKVLDYLEKGSKMVWVVYPKEQTVTIYRKGSKKILKSTDVLDGEDVISGFSVNVAEIFRHFPIEFDGRSRTCSLCSAFPLNKGG
jgi:Uma2 family endonuclease